MSGFPRSSGILCHLTSLPGGWDIGDLGDAAYRFVDWLAAAGRALGQVLPGGPPGYGESPYQSFSTFAGTPLLVGLDRLAADRWLPQSHPKSASRAGAGAVEFERVEPYRAECLT